MDPISSLIGKLNEQFQQKASPEQLLGTIRSLEAALLQETNVPAKSLGTAKVAVIMPANPVSFGSTVKAEAENAVVQAAAPESIPAPPLPEKENAQKNGEPKVAANGSLFDPMTDIPTLAQQKNGKEINETISPSPFSLNDMLKNNVLEVGHILTETPIRDLKKAIGINERFVFINELFRGDDTMYERSIKTINGFRILAEAQYWMERELKVKLGWKEESPVVVQFYHLVKRRFSGV